MKVYTVWKTDAWQMNGSKELVGVFSTAEKARGCILDYATERGKVIINSVNLDETDSENKFEVYGFEYGLEEKSSDSDSKIGSKEMVKLTSSYYKINKLVVFREDIERVITVYLTEMVYLGVEAKIEYMEVNEFLELDDTTINHVLYHAEQHDDLQLKNFFERLHKN